MKVALVFYLTDYIFIDSPIISKDGGVYILLIDREGELCLYSINAIIKKYLSRNTIHYIIQNSYSVQKRWIPLQLSRMIGSLYSMNFNTKEVIKYVKSRLLQKNLEIFGKGREVLYTYEIEI